MAVEGTIDLVQQVRAHLESLRAAGVLLVPRPRTAPLRVAATRVIQFPSRIPLHISEPPMPRFLLLAALNEGLRQRYNIANGNFGTWISLKLWLFMPLSFLFTFTQLPMLLRHGLMQEAESEVLADPPHE